MSEETPVSVTMEKDGDVAVIIVNTSTSSSNQSSTRWCNKL